MAHPKLIHGIISAFVVQQFGKRLSRTLIKRMTSDVSFNAHRE